MSRSARDQDSEALHESRSGAVVLLQPDGTVVYATCSLMQFLGFTDEELAGSDFFQLSRATGAAGEPVRPDALREPSLPPRLWRCRRKDGDWLWLEASGVRVPSDCDDGATLLTLRRVTGHVPQEPQAAEHLTPAIPSPRLLRALADAVHEEQFVLHYQPKVDIRTGRICGLEALARWHSADFGAVPPSQFIPVLEDSGLIVPMGEWVLRMAAADQRRWLARGLTLVPVAVNLSPVQLEAAGFVTVLESAVAQLPQGGALEIEITESVLVENVEDVVPVLAAARALGVSVAIDDFGTGYSSLKYLARLPVNALKIDRSFTREMLGDPRVATVVAGIISLARAMELRVVAEGVETNAELRQFVRLGCDEAQGFLLAPPMGGYERPGQQATFGNAPPGRRIGSALRPRPSATRRNTLRSRSLRLSRGLRALFGSR